MFQNMHFMTIVIPCVAVVVCVIAMMYFGRKGDKVISIALGLIVSGGAANLIDRIFLGFVTDMFDFRVFPVFNVADIGVTCGCALAILWVVFIDGKKGKE